MKALLFLLPIIFIFSTCYSQKELTLEAIWSGEFKSEYLEDVQHLSNSREYTVLSYDNKTEISSIIAHSYLNPLQKRLILSSKNLNIPYFETYKFNSKNDKILLGLNIENRYRRSVLGIYYVYDLKTEKLNQISKYKIIDPKFSPDGNKVSYTYRNNIYYIDLLKNKTTQITFDGVKNRIINGISDWVYEEEFEIVSAQYWNNESSQLAYLKFNETDVPEYSMPIYGTTNYPSKSTFKYPKAGEQNSSVTVHVYDIKNFETKQIKGIEAYYIPRIQWTNNSNLLTISTLNRHQNDFKLLSINTKTLKSKTIYTEKNNSYIEITDNLHFLKDNSFILSSEKDNYNHIYYFDNEGNFKNQITKGNWDVTKLYGINTSEKTIFYQSTEKNSTERQIFKIDINGAKKRVLTSAKGTHNANFNFDKSLFFDEFSNINTPYQYSIIDSKTKKNIYLLNDNNALLKKVKKYQFPNKEIATLTVNGNELNSWIIKPIHFDASKKYPLLIYQYSGPGSQSVKNEWHSYNDLWHFMLAQKGYIIACIDGRGTGFKGSDFKKQTQLQLGKFETKDQISFAEQLSKFSYIDNKRIGIWGWSYGGFIALNSILKGNGIFSTAISVAPVTHWAYYDTIYTERFLTTPSENPLGYNENSPLNYANMLKGELLLVHGTADDNVHLQNTLQMANALTRVNKAFDLAIYTDKNHGIYGGNTRLHLFSKMTNFILDNL